MTAAELKPGFQFRGARIPLVNPQRGIFKPQQMKHLLSIRTVFPRPGGRVWYDDQREVHRQIYDEMESVEYAFMGNWSLKGEYLYADLGEMDCPACNAAGAANEVSFTTNIVRAGLNYRF